MAQGGFFSRQDLKDARKRAPRTQPVSRETLHKLGPRGVKDMNPDALHPNMPATGARRPLLYVLGEAPGGTEDKENRQFVGKSGQYLRSEIPRWVRSKVRWNNTVGTRPPENRNPTDTEIECFRPSVVADIEKSKPPLVMGFGGVALKWVLGKSYSMTAVRGRRFPVRIGKHACWFYPMFHPAFIKRIERSESGMKKIPGREWKRYFEEDLARACRDVETLPEPIVEDPSEANLMRGVEFVKGKRKIDEALRSFESDVIAFDLETYPTRPYYSDSELLTAAFSDGELTFAFEWSDDLVPVLQRFFARKGHPERQFIAHSLSFEQEWIVAYLGREVLDPIRKWGCSLNAGYVLDQRRGGKSLELLCLQEFGLPIKQLSPYADRKDLRGVPMPKLLRYNALDAKYTARLFVRLMARVINEGLDQVYDSQIRRVPAFVLAQAEGIPLDQNENDAIDADLAEKLDDVKKRLRETPEVKVYERRHGTFNPAGQKDCETLFHRILRRSECVLESGKITTDEDALARMTDVEAAAVVLEYRRWAKLRSTYVTPFDIESKDSLVYPDGKLHCTFNPADVESGRSSANGPNMQNWANRKDKWVRKQVKARKGHKLVSIDQGQIEARGIAMHSRDPEFCRALWEDFDVHLYWAEQTAKAYPPKLDEYSKVPKKKRMKALRSEIKNQFVFPAFYLAGPKSIAAYLRIPLEIVKYELFPPFWEMFHGIKSWQKDMIAFYEKHGYVECMTGRRRWGPLSTSMIVNTPPQGTASDITIESWSSLSEKSREMDMPWLQPVLLVHDDITFIVPDEKLEEMIEIAVLDMLEHRWDWINVPLSVEVEYGQNWAEMKEIGTFRSHEL